MVAPCDSITDPGATSRLEPLLVKFVKALALLVDRFQTILKGGTLAVSIDAAEAARAVPGPFWSPRSPG